MTVVTVVSSSQALVAERKKFEHCASYSTKTNALVHGDVRTTTSSETFVPHRHYFLDDDLCIVEIQAI